MIRATFKLPDVEAFIQQKIKNAETAVLNVYKFAGETFVRNARLNGNYNDITGNLRSSIGYVIIQDGKQVDLNFTPSDNGTDKETGIAKGQELAIEISSRFPKGIILICVAGMEYAVYVEAKGKDVITGSTLELETQLKNLLRQL